MADKILVTPPIDETEEAKRVFYEQVCEWINGQGTEIDDIQENTETGPFSPTQAIGVSATGGYGVVTIQWTVASYTGHSYTNIYRSEDSNPANAIAVGSSVTDIYNDVLSDPDSTATYYYWVEHVAKDDNTGLWNSVAASAQLETNVQYAIDTLFQKLGWEEFNSSTFPIRSVDVLPTLPDADYSIGSVVFLTTDGQLYRNFDNIDWTDVVPATSLSGQITTTQITDDAITTDKINANAITATELAADSVIAGKLAAGALVVGDGVMENGYIKTALIGDAEITSAKIENAAITDAKIGGTISSTDGTTWSIDKAGGINCRNMTIRDSDGTILLQSGGDIDLSRVANAGTMAGIDQITSANVSTYIASAAIDTLFLAGQAVTIPVSAYTASVINVATTWVNIQTASIVSTGAPILISASFLNVDGEYAYIRIYEGATLVYDSFNPDPAGVQNGSFSATIQRTPGAGSVTYTLQSKTFFNSADLYHRSLCLLETKR